MPRRSSNPQRGVSLFESPATTADEPDAAAPLAARMRPTSLDEVLGQDHLTAPGTLLRRVVDGDRVPSMIFWGPPGTGKTTLARIIARASSSAFAHISAVTSGVADLRQVIAEAKERRRTTGERTILFIDEIHRFNKAQQDAILPHVEDGTVSLIGATTENPSFEVIAPLLSRSRVFTLNPIGSEQILALLRRALADEARGLGAAGIEADDDALEMIAEAAGGDARAALTTLELAANGAAISSSKRLTKQLASEALQHRALYYDKDRDAHYDTISAFIKSIRGSDPDAALYYLARMIDAGEDPMFIARRLVILAGEDVGLADPQGIVVAVAAQQATHLIGLPEALYPLAEATLYLATAPKSDSVKRGYFAALADAKITPNEPIPLHIRNAPTGLMKSLGYGKQYAYDHEAPGHYSGQEHLPNRLAGRRYFEPGTLGWEGRRREEIEDRRKRKRPPAD